MSNIFYDYQVCIVAYSERFRLYRDSLGFVEVVQQLGKRLGVHLGEFVFHTRENIADEGDQFVLDQENLNRLRQFSAQEPILDLILTSKDGNHDPAWDIYAELVDAKDIYGMRYAYFQFPLDLIGDYSEQSQFELFKGLLLSLNRLAELDYALVTTMEFADMPWLYFRGFLLPNMSGDLKLNLALWQRQQGECSRKMRDVYWMNFMGIGHLSSMDDIGGFLHRLEGLIGADRMTSSNDNHLVFGVPAVGNSPNPVAVSVQNLLMEHNLLMLPSVEDISVVVDKSFRRVRPTN